MIDTRRGAGGCARVSRCSSRARPCISCATARVPRACSRRTGRAAGACGRAGLRVVELESWLAAALASRRRHRAALPARRRCSRLRARDRDEPACAAGATIDCGCGAPGGARSRSAGGSSCGTRVLARAARGALPPSPRGRSLWVDGVTSRRGVGGRCLLRGRRRTPSRRALALPRIGGARMTEALLVSNVAALDRGRRARGGRRGARAPDRRAARARRPGGRARCRRAARGRRGARPSSRATDLAGARARDRRRRAPTAAARSSSSSRPPVRSARRCCRSCARSRARESRRLRLVLASDGARAEHAAFVARARPRRASRTCSRRALGLAYQVGKLPYAVLIDGDGVAPRARGSSTRASTSRASSRRRRAASRRSRSTWRDAAKARACRRGRAMTRHRPAGSSAARAGSRAARRAAASSRGSARSLVGAARCRSCRSRAASRRRRAIERARRASRARGRSRRGASTGATARSTASSAAAAAARRPRVRRAPRCRPSPGSAPAAIPRDGKDYVISYNDCCGSGVLRPLLLQPQRGRPARLPSVRSNDINWCAGASSQMYHCSTALVIGLAEEGQPEK